MTRFRPCIDLHAGSVKQIVGGTLSSTSPGALRTNHTSTLPASHFAKLYRDAGAIGAHVIMLGPGNEDAAREALKIWPGGLQVGGGIGEANAMEWVNAGAGKVMQAPATETALVIVTSYLFPNGVFSKHRLDAVLSALGEDKTKLVIDLSCRRRGSTWLVLCCVWDVHEAAAGAQELIKRANERTENIRQLEKHCSEFLIHAADNEGLQQGIDEELVQKLAMWCSIPVTYAGGGRHLDDLDRVKELSNGKVDLTIGSALDIFGGEAVKFEECMGWNRLQES